MSIRAVALVALTLQMVDAQNIQCDFSMCQEHSFGRSDSDCCGYDSATYCPTGVVKTKVLQSRSDVTWINAPSGFPSNWGGHVCSTRSPYRGNTCCINPSSVVTSDTFVFVSEPRTWSAARSDCQSRGGDLAWITSEAENAKAYSLTGGNSTWLGLTDIQQEGRWLWADGTPISFTPSSGEGFRRDNHAGNEDCAGFYEGRWNTVNAGMWDDMWGAESCTGSLPYLCRIPPSPPPSPPPPSMPPPSAPPPDLLPFIAVGSGGAVVFLCICIAIFMSLRKGQSSQPQSANMQGTALGAVPVAQSMSQVSSTTAASPMAVQLKELKELVDMGIITEADFEAKKQSLLNPMPSCAMPVVQSMPVAGVAVAAVPAAGQAGKTWINEEELDIC